MRYVGGTWRVGGILALSRAFGDAYLKGTGQFEGYAAGGDGYSSGFGVIADPSVTLTQLSCKSVMSALLGITYTHDMLSVPLRLSTLCCRTCIGCAHSAAHALMQLLQSN